LLVASFLVAPQVYNVINLRLILVIKPVESSERIAQKGIWVEPKLLAEIEYRAKSAEGKVRHPFFKGLQEDL
jgi:bifunctional non-homologous end joining protein LigD